MMNNKFIEDFIKSIQLDETYQLTSQKLNLEDQKKLEASLHDIANLIGPFVEAVNSLSENEEALALAKSKLTEKVSSG